MDLLQRMTEAKKAIVAQLALASLLKRTAVTTVVIGVNKMEQLQDNLKSIDIEFTQDELQQIADISKLPVEYPGWMLEFTGQDRQK